MLSTINIAILVLWAVSAALDYASFTYLWQLKEYRWDKFRDFLSTRQGKIYWTQYPLLWRSGAAVLLFFWPINSVLVLKKILIAFLLVDVAVQIFRVYKRRARIPVRTTKALLIVATAVFLEGLLFLGTREWAFLFFLLIVRFYIAAGAVYIWRLPTMLAKGWYIGRATSKLEKYSNLTVIGITGSYGKTSTKEFLNQILSYQYSVIATPEHTNTEIGVARFILETDFNNADYFVVEMGAYKMGEIQKICDMVRPKVGILTAINEQHLTLFGNIQKIQAAKYELLRSLPEGGAAITNADNPYCMEFLDELNAKAYTFGVDKENNPTLLITDVEENKTGITFTGRAYGQERVIEVPLKPAFYVTNVVAAGMAAMLVGMKEEELEQALKTISSVSVPIKQYTIGKLTVIDDSYNSNPTGFHSALEELSSFPSTRKRVVITRGMVELGKESDRLHEEIAGAIALYADELILLTPDAEAAFKRGLVGDKYKTKFSVIKDSTKLKAYLGGLMETDSVALIENRLPGEVAQWLKHKRGEA